MSNGNTIEWWIRKTTKESKAAFRGIIGEDEIMEEEKDEKEKEKEIK